MVLWPKIARRKDKVVMQSAKKAEFGLIDRSRPSAIVQDAYAEANRSHEEVVSFVMSPRQGPKY
jgi:hypothetical protein